MNKWIASLALVAAAAGLSNVRAQAALSALSAVSALPVASVLSVTGTASLTAGASVAIPLALSTAGAVLVVKAVEVSARGTVYLLERASDGARVSIEVVGRGAQSSAIVVGASVVVSVIGSGVLLSAAGEVIAFVPNAIGQALLHNERLTH